MLSNNQKKIRIEYWGYYFKNSNQKAEVAQNLKKSFLFFLNSSFEECLKKKNRVDEIYSKYYSEDSKKHPPIFFIKPSLTDARYILSYFYEDFKSSRMTLMTISMIAIMFGISFRGGNDGNSVTGIIFFIFIVFLFIAHAYHGSKKRYSEEKKKTDKMYIEDALKNINRHIEIDKINNNKTRINTLFSFYKKQKSQSYSASQKINSMERSEIASEDLDKKTSDLGFSPQQLRQLIIRELDQYLKSLKVTLQSPDKDRKLDSSSDSLNTHKKLINLHTLNRKNNINKLSNVSGDEKLQLKKKIDKQKIQIADLKTKKLILRKKIQEWKLHTKATLSKEMSSINRLTPYLHAALLSEDSIKAISKKLSEIKQESDITADQDNFFKVSHILQKHIETEYIKLKESFDAG